MPGHGERPSRFARRPLGGSAGVLLIAVAMMLVAPTPSDAATFTWQPTGSGTYSWFDTANWLGSVSGTYPNAANDATNLGTALTTNQTVSLGGTTVRSGTLTIGTTGQTLTLVSGTIAGLNLTGIIPQTSSTINYQVPISLAGVPAGTLFFANNSGATVRQNFYGDVLAGSASVALTPLSQDNSGAQITYFHGAIDPLGDSTNRVSFFSRNQGSQTYLLGASRYRGTTGGSGGTVYFNSIADTNVDPNLVAASALGAPVVASSTISLTTPTGNRATTFEYIGTGHASNRDWSSAGVYGGVIAASGEGTLHLSGNVSVNNSNATAHTLSGSGVGVLSGTISGTSTGSFVKSGAGTWTLTGTNTYLGNTAINGGVLRVATGILPSSGTLSFGGGGLASSGGTLTINNPLGIPTGGASFTGSESITLTGTMPTDANTRTITNLITGAGNQLTVGGLMPSTSGTSRLFLIDGTGNTSLGPVMNNTATGTMGLDVRSSGTTTLTAANTLTGTMTTRAGTLVADFTTATSPTTKLGSVFLFGGGSVIDQGADLMLSGTASGPVNLVGLRFGNATAREGAYTIRRASSDTVIQITGSMTKGNTAFTADFEPGAVVLTTGTSNFQTNGIIPYMTAGNDWAMLSGTTSGTIQAFTSYTNLPTSGTVSATVNYLLTGTGSYGGGAVFANSLKIVGNGNDQVFDIVTNFRNNSFLYAGGGNDNYSIAGSGTFQPGSGAHYWIIKTGTLTMNVATVVAPNSTFMKSGTGMLVWNSPILSGTQSFVASQGVLRLSNSLATGTLARLDVIANPAGSAVELVGGIALPAGKTHNVSGLGVANGGAIRNVSGSNSMAGVITIGGVAGTLNTARINADTGSQLTLTGGIVTASKLDVLFGGAGNVTVDTAAISGAGNLTKDGAGRLELKAANTYTGLTTVSAGELKVNGSIAASTAGVTNPFYVAAGATVSGTGTINAQAYFDGTLAPGNSPGTITYTSDVVWSGSSTWNFELSGTAAGQYDQVLITSGGGFYRDTSIAGSGAAGYYKFDFLNTGTAGTFRLVDWSGTTNFATANFGYQNLASGLSGTFNVDNTESALFFTVTSSGPASANYALGIGAAAQTIIQGGSTLITGTINNTGPDGGDAIGYTGFSGTSAAGSFALSPAAGTVNSKTTTTGTGSFTSNTPGVYTVTPAVASATNSVLGTAATLTSTGSVQINVLAHSSPTLTVASGGGQTIITGGTFAPISYTLSNPGANVSPLQSGSLANLTGPTGAAVVAAGTSAAYTATAPSSSTVTSGNLVVSLQAGDTQSYSGASPLQTLSGTAAYTVLDHATSSLLGGSVVTGTTISLGTWDYSVAGWTSGTSSAAFSIFNIAGGGGPSLTALLALTGTGASGDTRFTTNLDTFSQIAGGSSQAFTISFDPSTLTTSGTVSRTFTINLADQQNLSGAQTTNTLTVTANVVVVPEPTAIALAALGASLAAWAIRRRR